MAGEGVISKLQRLVGPVLLRSFNKEEKGELNRISCHRGETEEAAGHIYLSDAVVCKSGNNF